MIRFFRQLRQNLLSERKFNKYVLYAIGEIFLVMIGILLALQVNNWNQNRLNLQEEKVILLNLKEDFKKAIDEFNSLNSIRSSIISAAKTIMSIPVDEIDNYPTNYLDSLFSKTLFGPTFNSKAGSLDMLLNSGKINLIRNVKLKSILIEWPGDLDDMIEEEVNHDNLYRGPYMDILFNHASWNNMIKNYSRDVVRFDSPSLDIFIDNPNISSDFKAILGNKRFLNILQQRASLCILSNHETKVLIKKAEDLIEIIDSTI